jgi:cation:H+ antiporter
MKNGKFFPHFYRLYMTIALTSLVAGLVLLIKGADWLVNGASDIARKFGISDLVIGLTIVSFGTSAPELLVNVVASVQGSSALAVGNIVGSNISNTLLILGVASIIAPLAIQKSTVLKEIPFGILAACVLFAMANDALFNGHDISELSRNDGVTFLGFFIIFLYYTFGMRKRDENHNKVEKETRTPLTATLLIFIGLVGLSLGGKLAVDGAIISAKILGISEALIGLTVVAIGTSLPELAASAVAAYKGKADIAVGNIVGSNIFNILWILGISSIIKPLPFQPAINVDLLVVIFSMVLLFFIIHNGHLHRRLFLFWKQEKDFILNRWEGGVLLSSYVVYIIYISLRG